MNHSSILEACVLVNNNLCGKCFIIRITNHIERLKVISVSFFIADFNLLSCELDNFTFKMLYIVILC